MSQNVSSSHKWALLLMLLPLLLNDLFGADQNSALLKAPNIKNQEFSKEELPSEDPSNCPLFLQPSQISNSVDSLSVDQKETVPSPKKKEKMEKIKPILEAKLGYFIFSNAKMRKIYDQGGLDAQISGSYPVSKWLQIYGAVEYTTKHGKSLEGHQKTRIWEIPLSLGLKPVIKINQSVHYYITLGPRYFFVHTHNNSSAVDRKINKNGLGGFVNTGFNFFPLPHFCIDVFGEYSYQKIHVHPHKSNVFGRSIQIGGYTFGAGLGYVF